MKPDVFSLTCFRGCSVARLCCSLSYELSGDNLRPFDLYRMEFSVVWMPWVTAVSSLRGLRISCWSAVLGENLF